MRLRLSAFLIGACTSHMIAASFDCSKAATDQENVICADTHLSQLDEQMATEYKALLPRLSPNAVAEVKQDRREWLRWLPYACPNHPGQPARTITTCLTNEYSEQTAAKRDQLKRIAGITFFPRTRVIALAAREAPLPGFTRPDFFTGRLRWPEIDRPNPPQAVWNAAVRAQVAQWEGVQGGEVTVFWELHAANQRLISVVLENSRYNYGAAHPNEERLAFNWWLALQRPLRVEDVFRGGSGWQSRLVDRCYEQLTSDHTKDLYDDNTVRKAVADAAKDIRNWSVDSGGLTIEFPEYSVAPRVAGFLSVRIIWSQLRSDFAAGFDPATLPEPASTKESR